MKRTSAAWLLLAALALWPRPAHSFCGFYVASGNAKLFNRSSQVVLVRDADRTVMTMANDFKGDPKEFAVVVPVPTVLEKKQIHVGDQATVDHLDAWSAPRLVEYWDPNPCAREELAERRLSAAAPAWGKTKALYRDSGSEGVRIEARYTVGEYDILILSATQSAGLERWLIGHGYRIPEGASRVLGAYLKQGMKFFVAKVNLGEKERLGFTNLRPLQIAYESAKFMLPIRLGMVNADGPQELFVYALTRKGRVETTNYRNVKLPSDVDVPEYVKDEFAPFYRAMFQEQVRRTGMAAVFTEYAWDIGWCDPCASPPLTPEEQKALGVFWLDDPTPGQPSRGGAPTATFVTRLHVRYDRAHFPEDLVFQQTADRTNFQGRYVLHHPYAGNEECPELANYRRGLRERREKEARNLAELTGWSLDKVRGRMNLAADWSAPEDGMKWWDRLWR